MGISDGLKSTIDRVLEKFETFDYKDIIDREHIDDRMLAEYMNFCDGFFSDFYDASLNAASPEEKQYVKVMGTLLFLDFIDNCEARFKVSKTGFLKKGYIKKKLSAEIEAREHAIKELLDIYPEIKNINASNDQSEDAKQKIEKFDTLLRQILLDENGKLLPGRNEFLNNDNIAIIRELIANSSSLKNLKVKSTEDVTAEIEEIMKTPVFDYGPLAENPFRVQQPNPYKDMPNPYASDKPQRQESELLQDDLEVAEHFSDETLRDMEIFIKNEDKKQAEELEKLKKIMSEQPDIDSGRPSQFGE